MMMTKTTATIVAVSLLASCTVDAYVQTKPPPVSVIPPSARPHRPRRPSTSFKRRLVLNKTPETVKPKKTTSTTVVQVPSTDITTTLMSNAKTTLLLNQASYVASQGGTPDAIQRVVKQLQSQKHALGERVRVLDDHVTQLLSTMLEEDDEIVHVLKSVYKRSTPVYRFLSQDKLNYLLEFSRVCSREECNALEKEQVLDQLLEQRVVAMGRIEEMDSLAQVLDGQGAVTENKFALKAYNFN